MNKTGIAAVLTAAAVLAVMTAPDVYAEWKDEDDGVCYYDEYGDRSKGLKEINGETYYFDRKGIMQTGWQTMRHKYKAYFRSDGTMIRGRAKINGKHYFFNEKGYLTTGYVIYNDTIYHYGNDGEAPEICTDMLVRINNDIYLSDSEGKLKKGLQQVSQNNYYYFGESGRAESVKITVNNFIYIIDAEKGLLEKTPVKKHNEPENTADTETDMSKIRVSASLYSDCRTSMANFKAHNSYDGKRFYFSGQIQNIAGQPSCVMLVTLQLCNQRHEIFDEVSIKTPRLKVGDEYRFEDWCVVDEPVYYVDFKSKKLR